MSNNNIISIVENYAQAHSVSNDIHGFPHVIRVYNTCIQMGRALNADLLILKISALLHDIGRIKEKEDLLHKNHSEISAEMARSFFETNNFELSPDSIGNIVHAIRAHSFSNKVPARTLEAQILSDSDKLDAIGAIGIYRTIGFTIQNGGGIEQVLKHLTDKILKLKDLLYLEQSKKMAKERHALVLDYYKKLSDEIVNSQPEE